MPGKVKILRSTLEGDNVEVQCSDLDQQGNRVRDFNIQVPAYNPDHTPRSTEDIRADVENQLRARAAYQAGRAAPEIDLPDTFDPAEKQK